MKNLNQSHTDRRQSSGKMHGAHTHRESLSNNKSIDLFSSPTNSSFYTPVSHSMNSEKNKHKSLNQIENSGVVTSAFKPRDTIYHKQLQKYLNSRLAQANTSHQHKNSFDAKLSSDLKQDSDSFLFFLSSSVSSIQEKQLAFQLHKSKQHRSQIFNKIHGLNSSRPAFTTLYSPRSPLLKEAIPKINVLEAQEENLQPQSLVPSPIKPPFSSLNLYKINQNQFQNECIYTIESFGETPLSNIVISDSGRENLNNYPSQGQKSMDLQEYLEKSISYSPHYHQNQQRQNQRVSSSQAFQQASPKLKINSRLQHQNFDQVSYIEEQEQIFYRENDETEEITGSLIIFEKRATGQEGDQDPTNYDKIGIQRVTINK